MLDAKKFITNSVIGELLNKIVNRLVTLAFDFYAVTWQFTLFLINIMLL